MPLSRITSAMAAMSASVDLARSRMSTCISVRSGMMLAKSFACLTWPAITACVTPGLPQELDAAAQLAERHRVQGRAERVGALDRGRARPLP